MSGDRLQLGTVRLDLKTGPSTPSLWTPLNAETLSHLEQDIHPDSEVLSKSLLYLLKDVPLDFQAEYQRDHSGMIIRTSILPADHKDSTWKRSQQKIGSLRDRRKKNLRELFWNLREGWDGEGKFVMARSEIDLQRLPEIYRNIPSPPEPDFCVEFGMNQPDRDVRYRLMFGEKPEGVKTALYHYQARTVSRMLQMETNPGKLVDIHFTAFKEAGREGTYYLDPNDHEIQKHPGWYDLPRGGILAEQMGTGKTLAVLSLIIATQARPPSPPSDGIDISPAFNDSIVKKWPWQEYQRAREARYMRCTGSTTVPTLSELCAGVLARTDRSSSSARLVPPSAESIINEPLYYLDYPVVDDDCSRRARQKAERSKGSAKKVWLANTTLVVVPQILVEQWKQEIEKHLEPGTLKVLEIGKEPVPSVELMMEYDVVLIDVLRFGQEETLHRANRDLEESEFTKARWKRIVLDEGHVAGTKSDAMRLAISMSIERRWIVSGTPTKHLQQGGETEIKRSRPKENAQTPKSAAWPKRDLEDVTRIGVMVGGFLAMQPFQSEANFTDRITALLRKKDGPVFGAVRRLKYIMDALMVKHAPNVIDIEASLPPLTIKTEILDFHPMQRVTYNVLAALVASNVYTSNFEDPDYFLHPRNASSFKQVIQNLHLACFWYSAHDMGAEECLNRTRKHLETNTTLTDSGRVALEEAIHHLETALATPGWQEWMTNGVSIPFEAGVLPGLVRDAWSDSMDTSPNMIDASSLDALRNSNEAGTTLGKINIAGWDFRGSKNLQFLTKMEEVKRKAEREEQRKLLELDELDMVIAERAEKADIKSAAHGPAVLKPLVKAKLSAQAKKGKKSKLDERLDEAAKNAAAAALPVIPVGTPERDLGPRPLPMILDTKSYSSKLNFVIKSILGSDPEDKFVIFGDKYELGHVTEALDLIDVKSCFAGSTISAAKRIEALKEIEKPETKVILLDLKLGARGLNLVCANRMIFLAPVWNLDVQAQAIKRIHRIGQRKPTRIDILVTRGTFEEEISERSSTNRTDAEEQTYSRAMIENPSFVYPENSGEETFPIRFVPLGQAQSSPTASSPDISPTTPIVKNTRFGFPPVPTSPTIGHVEEADRVGIERYGPFVKGTKVVSSIPPMTKKRPIEADLEAVDKVEEVQVKMEKVEPPKKKRAKVTFA